MANIICAKKNGGLLKIYGTHDFIESWKPGDYVDGDLIIMDNSLVVNLPNSLHVKGDLKLLRLPNFKGFFLNDSGSVVSGDIIIEDCPSLTEVSCLISSKNISLINCSGLERINRKPSPYSIRYYRKDISLSGQSIIIHNCPKLHMLSGYVYADSLEIQSCPSLIEIDGLINCETSFYAVNSNIKKINTCLMCQDANITGSKNIDIKKIISTDFIINKKGKKIIKNYSGGDVKNKYSPKSINSSTISYSIIATIGLSVLGILKYYNRGKRE